MGNDTKLFIRGKAINFEEDLLDINEVCFYENNPRIASIISTIPKDELTNDLIDEKLWENNNTHKLKRQIEVDGGLIHPIIVYDGKVLEGNTRLCCYKHLLDETKNEKWNYIRAHVIKDKLLQDDIYRLLCSEHIDGKIEWDPYEKANLFNKMYSEESKSIEDISKLTNESKNSINQMVKAYEIMVNGGELNKRKFSYYLELVKSNGIRKYKKKDPEIEKKVITLIKEDKFEDAKDIRRVTDILEDKKSTKRLLENKENFDRVYIDLKSKKPLIGTTLYSDLEHFYNKIANMKRVEREKLKNDQKICLKMKKLTKELIKLCQELEINISFQ